MPINCFNRGLEIRSRAEFDRLVAGAAVIRADRFGVKVYALADGRMLKLFRRKRLLSSQIWAPYALRFARNAEVLKRRGFRTVEVESVARFPELDRDGVVYRPVSGKELRDCLARAGNGDGPALVERFGRFVAELHSRGVRFRSLHLANVIVLDPGEFALIDISDLDFKRTAALGVGERRRNFRHMTRYAEDRAALSRWGEDRFGTAYFRAFSCTERVHGILDRAIRRALSGPRGGAG
jgi:tRNA A-37 threonylcarbamoyl transferase component Bud32